MFNNVSRSEEEKAPSPRTNDEDDAFVEEEEVPTPRTDNEDDDSTGGNEIATQGYEEDEIFNQNNDRNEEDRLCCFNCHRRQSLFLYQEFGPLYQTDFFEVMNCDIKKRRRFKLCTVDSNAPNEYHTFCCQCTEHLTCVSSKEANTLEFTWPAFVWYFLCDFQATYQPSHLWKFIPFIWRYWWLDEFKSSVLDSNERNNISLRYPKPFFIDRSCEMQEWEEQICSQTLPNLRTACNKFCIPNVLCPFGCSTFIFRNGYIGFDIIILRFLPKCIFKKFLTNKNLFKFVESVRDDYIREDDDYNCWLLNRNWCILPTLCFYEGAPFVMTCDDHHGGTTKLFIHPPRSPLQHNLPSKYSDQLCHCSIRTRTIKPMAKKYYSNAFQMHEQRGSFNGVDTCNISSYRKFDFVSSLLTKFESVSIVNRADINSLLNQLVEERVMSKSVAIGKRNFAYKTCSEYNFKKYYKVPHMYLSKVQYQCKSI